ncbi:MAG: FeS assembly SUF system protein [Bacteroidetes bacterium GWE2_29_8]|nr:MAG: FeS assembly SUF system protein [Bacteroidetes bacterium GWE2_29_8]OFY20091.1 MAG: FeS assembly SUF system protein [Bacteroidetes bacterium GWF2_29_10]
MGNNYLELESKIVDILKTITDPEIPVNIYDLGLIYEINVDEEKNVKIVMTLTSPNCPIAESLPDEIKNGIGMINEIQNVEIEIVFEPEWNKDMMSENAKLELGFL